MTLAIVLETWFKVTAHTIHKGTLYVKYKSDWAEGREDMPRISDLRFTEGQTDRQTDHYEAPAERGLN